jgi:hypothetical protein
MNWKKWIESVLKALLLFGIVLFLCWIFECVIAKGELDIVDVVLSYILTDTSIRYYEKEE